MTEIVGHQDLAKEMKMKIEDSRRVFPGAGDVEEDDEFPIGMRVLAVDDDPVCLKVLETMLLRCQYHVTVTSRATDALEMLREKKDGFDLVISDVHMPDMDGFKLLELVGLEMDLPVIMLSVNSDKESVMRGITHGACNYLVKPVRIEELKNIWQYVVRKRFDSKDRSNDKKINRGDNCVTDEQQGQDQSRRHIRKRKAQSEERGYDSEENGQETDDDNDSSAHKKPRVVWSLMLHQKFVVAVNLLGIDKAVPKKILEIMDVEGLTRENVASHLQKYRQCLKKLSSKIIQPDDVFASMGGMHSFVTRATSIDDLRNNHYRFPGSRQPSSGLPFLQQHRGYNRLMNTAAGLSGLASSGSGGFQIGQRQRLIGLPPSHDPWRPPQYDISRIQQSFERNQCHRSKPLPQGINTTFSRSPSNGRFPSSNPDYSLMFHATDNNHQLLQHLQFIGNDNKGLSRPTNTDDHGACNRSWHFDSSRMNASAVTPISDHMTTGRELQTCYDHSNRNQLLSAVIGSTGNSNKTLEEQRQEDYQLQNPDHLPTTSPNNDDQVDYSFNQKDGLQNGNGKPEEIMNMTTTSLFSHNCKDAFGFEPTDFEIDLDANSNSSFDYLLHSVVKQDEHMAMDKDFLLT